MITTVVKNRKINIYKPNFQGMFQNICLFFNVINFDALLKPGH